MSSSLHNTISSNMLPNNISTYPHNNNIIINNNNNSNSSCNNNDNIPSHNTSASDLGTNPNADPSQWGVSEVYNFIRSLTGCSLYADDFRKQEIDGQALLLLTEDHLMTAMNVKLGPALKICSNIRAMKDACNSSGGGGGV
ncbi:hypothetical protein HELRODRAFT_108682 [Helobdella robusta]|uniref:SAM domain-containing protein n=1 Tax=Helobdella robusta TaxID=6412 RepID=T1EEL4_HELRO|nr:hypothetical protein HELRODRAFT_108682 [Helobdella robusta]ESN90610.1 hypothetical protein HELRODRAFT_108682 [Helobdella robusta]